MQMAMKFSQARRYWLGSAVRGLIAILFGLATFLWPHFGLLVLVLLFGVLVLLDGIFAMTAGVVERGIYRHWWVLLLEGFVGLMVGVMTFAWPHITALVLLYLIAAWAIVTGIFKITSSLRLWKAMKHEWLLLVSGLISLIFGSLLALQPAAGVLALLWLIGIYTIVLGVFLLFLAFWLRKLITA
jgi:uncharacterized membrane protein HdeD (DUF308 family)